MSRFALCTLTVGALSLILTLPTEAEACSCITPTIEVVAPADGAVDVPTNARLWVGGIDSGPSLMDASGTEVPGTVSSLRSLGGIVRIFTPDAPLTPGATYTGIGADRRRTIFTVGSAPDTTPPAVPSITSRKHDPGRTFGTTFGGSNCDSADDRLLTLGIADSAVVTLVDINETSNLNTSVPEGPVSIMSDGDGVAIGKSACLYTWEGTGDMGVRLATFDVAGNFSGWSEESAEVVETVGCSCDSTSPSRGGGPLLAALSLGLLLRRRRRTTNH